MLNYLTVPVTPYKQNCSLLWCDQSMKAAVLDPGGDLELVLDKSHGWVWHLNRSGSRMDTSIMPEQRRSSRLRLSSPSSDRIKPISS